MAIRAAVIVGLTGGIGLSANWINVLIANKFSEILQDLLYSAFDQFEFYVVILMIGFFAFTQFQAVYIHYASSDGVIDRLELFGVKMIDILSVVFLPAIVGVITQILVTQSTNSELTIVEVVAVGLFIIIFIFIFTSQISFNNEKLQYAPRRFIARQLIHLA